MVDESLTYLPNKVVLKTVWTILQVTVLLKLNFWSTLNRKQSKCFPKCSIYSNKIAQCKIIPPNVVVNQMRFGLVPQMTNNIHSYCASFLRQHGGPSEPFFNNTSCGWWLKHFFLFVPFFFFFFSNTGVFPPFWTAWLKATCYLLSLTRTKTHNGYKSRLWHEGCR